MRTMISAVVLGPAHIRNGLRGMEVHAVPDGKRWRFELRDTNTKRLQATTMSPRHVWRQWGVNPPLYMCTSANGARVDRPATLDHNALVKQTKRRLVNNSKFKIGSVIESRHNSFRRAKVREVRVVEGVLNTVSLEFWAQELRPDGTKLKRDQLIKVTPANWRLTP